MKLSTALSVVVQALCLFLWLSQQSICLWMDKPFLWGIVDGRTQIKEKTRKLEVKDTFNATGRTKGTTKQIEEV